MNPNFGKGSLLSSGRSPATVAFRDRNVSVRSVVCPICNAAVGEPCLSGNGEQTNHRPRRRMALRAEVVTWDTDDIRFVRLLAPSERKAIRHKSKVSLAALAEMFGTSKTLIANWESGKNLPSTPEVAAAYGKWLRQHRDVVA